MLGASYGIEYNFHYHTLFLLLIEWCNQCHWYWQSHSITPYRNKSNRTLLRMRRTLSLHFHKTSDFVNVAWSPIPAAKRRPTTCFCSFWYQIDTNFELTFKYGNPYQCLFPSDFRICNDYENSVYCVILMETYIGRKSVFELGLTWCAREAISKYSVSRAIVMKAYIQFNLSLQVRVLFTLIYVVCMCVAEQFSN